MSYDISPMSEFNKSNPLVMLCKREYTNIINDLQNCSKIFLQRMIAIGVLFLFLIAGLTVGIVLPNVPLIIGASLAVLVILVMCLLYYLFYRRIAMYYMHDHRGMREFDRISDLELNEILKIGHEEILNCLHGLYELKGGLEATVRFIKSIGMMLILLETLMIIGLALPIYIILGGPLPC